MRKIFCLFLLIAFAGSTAFARGDASRQSAGMTSRVDPRFELTSIVFRLAGAQEYAQCGVPGYARDLDAYFLAYADHPLIAFIQQIRRDYSIGYNAVSGAADWLQIKNGKVTLAPGYDAADISKTDIRWTEPVFRRYLKLLDDFYRESKFQKFYDDHAQLYVYAQGQLDSLLKTVDPEWFKQFYGKEFGNPDIFIGLCNGPNNYALPETIRQSGYGIVIGCGSDQQGQPAYNPLFLTIVLHEFAHNYSNPVFDEYWPQMEQAAGVIYPHVAERMAQIAYGDAKTTMGEWFNNLCILMCFREMESPWLDPLSNNYQEQGFIWMNRSVRLMDEFYADRERYPHIGDFMPRIVEFVQATADDFEAVQEEFKKDRPSVVAVTPAVGAAVEANAMPTEIVVLFSEPMFTGSYGANWIDREGIERITPEGGLVWRDERTLVIPLAKDSMEPGKTYGVRLLSFALKSAKGLPMADNYEVWFTIK